MLIIAMGSIFGVLVLTIVALLGVPARSAGMDDRMQEAEQYRVDFINGPTQKQQEKPGIGMVQLALHVADWFVRIRNSGAKIAMNLDRAGLELKPQEWMAIRLSAVAVLTALIEGNPTETQRLLPCALVDGATLAPPRKK